MKKRNKYMKLYSFVYLWVIQIAQRMLLYMISNDNKKRYMQYMCQEERPAIIFINPQYTVVMGYFEEIYIPQKETQ